ncbi:hypothetical protein RSSM_02566 [Rhodopirellula sallentina SM41]|uniref:Uncharacterized protein n=1 Tax=Rhodopirellula sallentina SM41 TaxID=1263870 RepID=M5U3H0_9BACT|nr:hypothetical protein RSSM_02566 [Rhodopirellula sallentina SM41]
MHIFRRIKLPKQPARDDAGNLAGAAFMGQVSFEKVLETGLGDTP